MLQHEHLAQRLGNAYSLRKKPNPVGEAKADIPTGESVWYSKCTMWLRYFAQPDSLLKEYLK
jgi:hypothetical protein